MYKYIHNDMVNSKKHGVQLEVFNEFRFPQLVPISNGLNKNILDFLAKEPIFAIQMIF